MKPLSVSDISRYITQIFDYEEMLHNVKVFGEISGFGIVRGNAYFTLKDENSILSCILFGADKYSNIKDGDQVVLDGSLRYYAKGGKVNFYTTYITPYGQGLLYQKFLELKEKLQQEGLFDSKYKKSLPDSIMKVGIITSKTGAVLHDLQSVISRRNPMINIYLYPAKVQGDGTDTSVIEGIEYFEKTDVDVVIIARGGGSIEDLWGFNSETLARKVFESQKPIVSAVGHETDYTILDFVADLRAPTPSVAGELVAKDLMSTIPDIKNSIVRMLRAWNNIVEVSKQIVVDKSDKLYNNLDNRLDKMLSLLKLSSQKLRNCVTLPYMERQNFIENRLSVLSSLNPANLLMKGYSIATSNKVVVGSIGQVNIGDSINIELIDGNIGATVDSKKGR